MKKLAIVVLLSALLPVPAMAEEQGTVNIATELCSCVNNKGIDNCNVTSEGKPLTGNAKENIVNGCANNQIFLSKPSLKKEWSERR